MHLHIQHPTPPLVFEPKWWQAPLIKYWTDTRGRMHGLMLVNFFLWSYGAVAGAIGLVFSQRPMLVIAAIGLGIALITEIAKRLTRSAGERFFSSLQARVLYTQAHGMYHAIEDIAVSLQDVSDRMEVVNKAAERISDVTCDPDDREATADLVEDDLRLSQSIELGLTGFGLMLVYQWFYHKTRDPIAATAASGAVHALYNTMAMLILFAFAVVVLRGALVRIFI